MLTRVPVTGQPGPARQMVPGDRELELPRKAWAPASSEKVRILRGGSARDRRMIAGNDCFVDVGVGVECLFNVPPLRH